MTKRPLKLYLTIIVSRVFKKTDVRFFMETVETVLKYRLRETCLRYKKFEYVTL